jgi:hypothetical protein
MKQYQVTLWKLTGALLSRYLSELVLLLTNSKNEFVQIKNFLEKSVNSIGGVTGCITNILYKQTFVA